MREKKTHINIFSADDIRRYLSGAMTAVEMHALEEAALRDPFLADAIEGIESRMKQGRDAFETDTRELSSRLQERIKEKPRVLSIRDIGWKAAVMVAAVAGGLAVSLNMPQEKAATAVALNTVNEAQEVSADRASLTSIDSAPPKPSMGKSLPKQPLSLKKNDDSAKDEELNSSPTSAPFMEARQDEAIADISQELPGDEHAETAPQRSAASADVSGEKDKNVSVSEVVVTGYGADKRKIQEALEKEGVVVSSTKKIIPVDGWEQFHEYISRNHKLPAAYLSIRGKQVVSFEVDHQGRPSSLSIVKSLSVFHNTECLRLLREGPDWEVIKGKKRKVSLTFIF